MNFSMTTAYLIAFFIVDFAFGLLAEDWTIKDILFGEFIVILLAAAPIFWVAQVLYNAGYDNFCMKLWFALPAWFRVVVSILLLTISILILSTVVSSTTVVIE
jgi:hypothetical protein